MFASWLLMGPTGTDFSSPSFSSQNPVTKRLYAKFLFGYNIIYVKINLGLAKVVGFLMLKWSVFRLTKTPNF